MGLDMYTYITYEDIAAVDFSRPNDAVELTYWRKHPNLHGWMELLYRSKGGKAEQFNCVPVQIDAVDLARLAYDIKNNRLPYTQGFFFGSSNPDNEDRDLDFVGKAEEAISKGAKIFYWSWW